MWLPKDSGLYPIVPHKRTPIGRLELVAFTRAETYLPLRTNTANPPLSEFSCVFFRPRGREVKATGLYPVEAAAR
jgi:hypothetical protein